jgi:uncharacterized membrane protein
LFDLYTVLRFLHLLAAIFWVGGGFQAWLSSRRGTASTARFLQATAGADMLYPIAAVTILVTGIWMVVDSYSFSQAWVIIGIVLFVATGPIGGGIVSRRAAAVTADLESGIETPESVGPRLASLRNVFNLDVAILFLLIVVMVFKPGV